MSKEATARSAISTERAMKLALEALEGADWYINQLELTLYSADDAGTHENRLKVQQAITVMRLEIDAQNMASKPAQQALDKMAENARKLGIQMQPAQQEPVAWRNAALRVGEDLCSVGPFGYYDMTAEQWLDWALSVVTVHAPPRTQPPAQRTWVALTDEEKRQIFEREDYQGWLDYINAIEAKLRSKNEDRN